MKRKNVRKRALAAVLAAAQALALALLPAPKAEAADFTLGSGFTDPTITVATMYYWKEGVPPVVQNADGKTEGSTIGVEYPIIITWDDQYAFNVYDPWSAIDVSDNSRVDQSPAYWRYYAEVADENAYNLPSSVGYYDRGLPAGYRARWRTYNESCINLFNRMDIAESLKKTGLASSMDVPTNMYAVPAENGGYGIEIGKGSDRWLLGELSFLCESRSDRGFLNTMDWYLHTSHVDRKDFTSAVYGMPVRRGHADTVDGYDSNAWYTKVDLDHRTWTFGRASDGTYSISTAGAASWFVRDWNSSGVTGWKTTAKDFVNGGIWNWSEVWLCHDIEWFDWSKPNYNRKVTMADDKTNVIYVPDNLTYGLQTRGVHKDDLSHERLAGSGYINYHFRVFYGEPNIVSFLQSDTVVQSGQVVNLDGPIVIGENATVTVEEGGVLVVSGWVMNGGYIMVKPGGMLIVQDQERLDGTHQYGVVNCYKQTPNRNNGRISCDGIMIVNRDCKVIGAGAYGLQFGEGAQCVNYGQLISENFEVYGDHTIENRGDVSAVYAGWGLTGDAYVLVNRRLAMGATFDGQGTIEKASAVRMAKDAVYGDGASRVYINRASKVKTQTGMANRKGHTTDVDPSIASYLPRLDAENNVFYFVDGGNYRYDWYDGLGAFVRFEYEDGAFKRYDFAGRSVAPENGAPVPAEGVAIYDSARNNFYIRSGGTTYWYNGAKQGFLDESALTDVYYTGTARFPGGVTGAPLVQHGGSTGAGAAEVVLEDGAVYAIETGLKAGVVLDVYGASKDNGGNIQLFENDGSTSKRWRLQSAGSETKNGQTVNYYKFINVNSGRALSIDGSTYSSGTNVAQYTLRDNGDHQKWRLIPNGDGYTIVPKYNENLALDVSGGSSGNGTNIQLDTRGADKANQRWKLIKGN